MPDREKFTLPQEGPPSSPPAVDPDRWEEVPVFRETFLLHFTPSFVNAALRTVGITLYDFVLEWRHYPHPPEGFLKAQLRAVLADVRHAQGYLATIAGEGEGREGEEAVLFALAGSVALELQAAADRLEAGL